MKTKLTTLLMLSAVFMMAVLFQACGTDSGPEDLNIESMTVGGQDLNAAESPEDVPADASIEVTFSSNVQAATATSANIMLVQDYNDEQIPLDISVSGATITITPQENLGSGALYQLTLSSGLLNEDDQPLANTTRSFSTAGTFAPAGMVANWTFEDTADDVVGTYSPSASGVVAITYTDSRNDAAGMAATFDGDASIIEIPNGDQLIDTEEFTMSFWLKTNSTNHVNENGDPAGHFVFGLAAFHGIQMEIPANYSQFAIPNAVRLSDGTVTGAGNMNWNGDGITGQTGGYVAITVSDEEDVPALIKDKWTHVTIIVDGPNKSRSLYVNGQLRMHHDFTLLDADSPLQNMTGMAYNGSEPDVYPELAFGFIQSRQGTMWDNEPWGGYDFPTANHFKGQLDDIKIYHKALTETEIQLMYDSES
ncbi:Ig-like domain-containing protein [Rhodohalobacter sp. 614A]|uniref:Ig-like domain-containing protein n=1 Tax=Rhodohalobacter sp. 614A TaxID=2908649 RepID=UPI001F1942BC|nr:LamG-like jellyroll fold domain-containing protein [Rhodohalobacter sp. 614A]